jgi:hypothetical protein
VASSICVGKCQDSALKVSCVLWDAWNIIAKISVIFRAQVYDEQTNTFVIVIIQGYPFKILS